MLAARIKLGKKLFDHTSTPSFTFIQNNGKLKLNMSIDLNPESFELIEGGVVADTHMLEQSRDILLGEELLRSEDLDVIQLDLIDPAEPNTRFTVSAVIDTKLPA